MSLSRWSVWMYGALSACVLALLVMAFAMHLDRVHAFIRGGEPVVASGVQWVEVCTPQGMQRVALDD